MDLRDPNIPATDLHPAETTPPQQTATEAAPILTKTAKHSMEELDKFQPHRIPEDEKNAYIKYLREELNKTQQQTEAYKANADKAYEAYRQSQQAFGDFKVKAQAKLNFTRQAIDHCRTSIILAGNLEE